MKEDILKIAGVKSEAEFYKKFPTEESFMAKHGKALKKAAMGKSMVKKQLTQLTDFANPPQAKVGDYISNIPSEYKFTTFDPYAGNVKNRATYNPVTGRVNSKTGQVSMADTKKLGFDGSQKGIKDSDADSTIKDLAIGLQMMQEEREEYKKAKQYGKIADLASKASSTRDLQKRRYVRPEDYLMGSENPLGVDTNFLAENGIQIGGNLTEIQNTYAPNVLYDDLGYEPLSDSDKVKQFKDGGFMSGITPDATGTLGSTFGSFIGGGKGKATGAGKVGSTVGGIAGTAIAGPVGGLVGSALGGLVGGAIGGSQQRKIEQQEQKIGNLAFQQGVGQLQNRMSAFMEDGGEVGLKYLSHDWQPQVIAKFGEYDVNDLLAPPKDADMLRAGGEVRNIRSNYMGNDERLSMMQMGGELETYWGGDAETISYNPYLPDGGETIMFRGQSHDESDGQGRTGIGIKFGESPVEVERGEPAVKLKDGDTGEENLVVYGNMKIPSYGITELNDPKAKGKKFKTYVADLSKSEAKQNKIIDKNINLVNNIDGDNPFDMLKLASAKAMLTGADMKLKDISMKKQTAAGVQNAILDTAEEMGVESDALSKGKLKPIKNSDMAKFGAKMETAQNGIVEYLNSQKQDSSFANRKKLAETYGVKNYKGTAAQNTQLLNLVKIPKIKMPYKPTAAQIAYEESQFRLENPEPALAPFDSFKSFVANEYPIEKFKSLTALPTAAELEGMESVSKEKPEKDKFGFMDIYNSAYPYIKPQIQNRIDPMQFAGEMFALSSNQLEPVQAQTYQPMLEQVSSISLQDQLNEIQSQTNAAMRMAGGNPAAQAMIAAQASSAKNKVLGEQFRMNQAMSDEVRRRNIATLNDATLKNLAILDQQYQRQEAAKSKTKAQSFEALSSIAEKIGKNKAETLSANVMANMYPNYTFGSKGRIFNTGVTKFNTGTVGDMTLDQFKAALKNDEKKEDKKEGKARNGSIVKAIKGL